VTRRHLPDATLAVANVVFETARVPLRAAERLPGIGFLSFEGAAVRGRLRSRAEGLVEDLFAAPEVARAIDRALTRALLDDAVLERLATAVEVTGREHRSAPDGA
jgi:hypothetical protein